MIQSPIKAWSLLAASGIFNAVISAMYFGHAEYGIHSLRVVVHFGELTLAAGICSIAAGLWNPASRHRLLRIFDGLVLNGLACVALGLLLTFRSGPTTFRTVALLVFAMSVGLAIHQFTSARTLPRTAASNSLHAAAGFISLSFAIVFLAFALRWIKLDPSPSAQTFLWLGFCFSFSAICMLGMALRNHRAGRLQAGHFQVPAAFPKPAL